MKTKRDNKFMRALREIGMFLYKFRYFFMKLGISLLTLAVVVILSFVLITNMPTDVIEAYSMKLANERRIPMEQARILAKQILNYDPDAPLLQRFLDYIVQIAHGNLGVSVKNNYKSVNVILRELLPATLFVSSISLAISFIGGSALGAFMAWRRRSVGARIADGYTVLSNAVPDYIFALIAIMIFSFRLGWFPNEGVYSPYIKDKFSIAFVVSCFYYATLPILSYVFSQLSFWTLQMRGSAVGVLGEDYINAARARGIPDKVIVRKHLKKNAILPLVTQLAISFGTMFGGAPLMESIFNYQGIGLAFSQAIGDRDYYLVQGILLFISVIIIAVNLVADLLYSIIDPRVRRGA